jgi:hypothetical protein
MGQYINACFEELKTAESVAQTVKHFPNKCKALRSNPSTAKNSKKSTGGSSL